MLLAQAQPDVTVMIGVMVLSLVLGLAFNILVGTVLFRASAKYFGNIEISFGSAAFTTVLNSVLVFIESILFVCAFIGFQQDPDQVNPALFLIIPITFLITSLVTSAQYELSFGKGAWIQFGVILISFGLIFVVTLAMFLFSLLLIMVR